MKYICRQVNPAYQESPMYFIMAAIGIQDRSRDVVKVIWRWFTLILLCGLKRALKPLKLNISILAKNGVAVVTP